MPFYLKHDYISKSQAQYFVSSKQNLEERQFLVTLDFAENYSFKIQDAVQAYHWSNDQATLHPYVIYYKLEEKVVNECFVVISENNHHDSYAVNLFYKKMINHLQLFFGSEKVLKNHFFL